MPKSARASDIARGRTSSLDPPSFTVPPSGSAGHTRRHGVVPMRLYIATQPGCGQAGSASGGSGSSGSVVISAA